jgi:hypothetical protein
MKRIKLAILLISVLMTFIFIVKCKKSNEEFSQKFYFSESFEKDTIGDTVPDRSRWLGGGKVIEEAPPNGGKYSLYLLGQVYWTYPDHNNAYIGDSASKYFTNLSGHKIFELSAYMSNYEPSIAYIKLQLIRSGKVVKWKKSQCDRNDGYWQLVAITDTMELEITDTLEIQLYEYPFMTRDPSYYDLIKLQEK